MILRRALQLGFSVADLDLVSIGMIMDVLSEAHLDDEEQSEDRVVVREATQDDFDKF